MKNKNESDRISSQIRFQTTIAIVFAFILLLLTFVSIEKSKNDSLRLLSDQGRAFTEALAHAADNAIKSESFFDYLVHSRYSDLVLSLEELNLNVVSEQELSRFRLSHDLLGVIVFDSGLDLEMSTFTRNFSPSLPEFVMDEINDLFSDQEMNFVLLTDQDPDKLRSIHYYLEKSSSLDRIIVLVIDALYYEDALRQTGIGFLAQKMARENGVEYILYQTTEGIIFASKNPGDRVLAIESDPFLSDILQTDSTGLRNYELQGIEVLEVVRPFASESYPFGLFRVGISLESYHTVSRSLTIQLFALTAILLLFLFVLLLYLNGRLKRAEIGQKYLSIKSLTDQIFDQMQSGVIAVDNNNRICLTNDAIEKILNKRDILQKSWSDLLPKELIDKISEDEKGNRHGEFELQNTVSGKEQHLLFVWSESREENNKQSTLVIVVTDVSELREYQILSGRKERLSEMGELAAGVAHEIRNPLNAISIAAQRLANEFDPRENKSEYDRFTSQIKSESKRLNEIITRFLALSKAKEKDSSLIDFKEFINELNELILLESQKMNIELKIEIADDLIIKGDKNRLKEMFLNLFNNAKEALSGKDRIISIKAFKSASAVHILFSDSGHGIKSENIENIFKPYYTTKDSGTGLGLPTVHQIVDEFSGRIEIADSEYGGASFLIILPISNK